MGLQRFYVSRLHKRIQHLSGEGPERFGAGRNFVEGDAEREWWIIWGLLFHCLIMERINHFQKNDNNNEFLD